MNPPSSLVEYSESNEITETTDENEMPTRLVSASVRRYHTPGDSDRSLDGLVPVSHNAASAPLLLRYADLVLDSSCESSASFLSRWSVRDVFEFRIKGCLGIAPTRVGRFVTSWGG